MKYLLDIFHRLFEENEPEFDGFWDEIESDDSVDTFFALQMHAIYHTMQRRCQRLVVCCAVGQPSILWSIITSMQCGLLPQPHT